MSSVRCHHRAVPSRTRRLTLVSVAGATLVALLAPVGAQQAVADPPTQPECLPLAGGSTGLLVVGGELPSEDQVVGEPGGFGAPASAGVAATLPDRVLFKTTRETWSNEYAFALRDRRIYVRQ